MNAEDVNQTDWSKIAMGIAVAIVFVMQQYHAMKLNEVKATIIPRTEFNDKMEFNAENRKLVFRDIDRRLKRLEVYHDAEEQKMER